MSDVVGTVANVAGVVTGNPWIGPAVQVGSTLLGGAADLASASYTGAQADSMVASQQANIAGAQAGLKAVAADVAGAKSGAASVASDVAAVKAQMAATQAQIVAAHQTEISAVFEKAAAGVAGQAAADDIAAALEGKRASDIQAQGARIEAQGYELQAAGSELTGAAALLAGYRTRLEAEFEAQQNDVAAGQALAAAHRDAFLTQRDTTITLSRAQALAAASGGSAMDPGVVRLMGDIAGIGAYKAGVALYAGEESARILRMAAAGKRYEGASAQLLGVSQKAAQDIQAAAMRGTADVARLKGEAIEAAGTSTAMQRIDAAKVSMAAAVAQQGAAGAKTVAAQALEAALAGQGPAFQAKIDALSEQIPAYAAKIEAANARIPALNAQIDAANQAIGSTGAMTTAADLKSLANAAGGVSTLFSKFGNGGPSTVTTKPDLTGAGDLTGFLG